MSIKSITPSTEQPSNVTPNETKKTNVFLDASQYLSTSAVVCLEVPVDATEEEIKALGNSVWKQLAPCGKWSLDSPLGCVWGDDVEIDVSDASDEKKTDARAARTLDGQLVVLAN